MFKIGAVSRSFGGKSVDENIELMQKHGFSSTELCFTFAEADYWCYNGAKPLDGFDGALVGKIAEKYRRAGIYIASIGVFSSLLEPDSSLLERNMISFERHIEAAAAAGIPAVATECGFIPGRRGVNTDTYETDFTYFKDNLAKVLELCEKKGVDLALECCVLDVVPSAKRARDLIEQCGSKRLKVLLDPANLIANSSEEDMFKYLAPYISYFHGKDRKVNDTYGREVGDGDIDWPLFFRLYHEHTEGVPFILEYVNENTCGPVKERALAFEAASRK